ncbi:MAG: transglutaminase-like cysteine peptidase [Rhodospirillales bacterium]|nr:transglutaminase-like cysteine peptidase [Rhodospirillales bacterium]
MTSEPSTWPSIWPELGLAASLTDFLRRYPDELAGGPVQPTPPGWFDANRAREIAAVHHRMLAAGYESDERRYGRADYWAIDASGDCEDKALWCHRRLAALGWPKSAMRLWLCVARQADRWRGHAALVVSLTLSDGTVCEVALDCLRATPTRKADLGYRLWRIVDPASGSGAGGVGNGAAGQD